jgi:hypothetical protein
MVYFSFHVCCIFIVKLRSNIFRVLGYFSPQKRFHINSKGKSSWCYVFSSKGQYRHHCIGILAQKKYFQFLKPFCEKQIRNAVKRQHLKVVRYYTGKRHYIDRIITRTNLVYYKEHYKEYAVTRGSEYRHGFG